MVETVVEAVFAHAFSWEYIGMKVVIIARYAVLAEWVEMWT